MALHTSRYTPTTREFIPSYGVAAEHNVVVYYHHGDHGGGIGAGGGPAYNAPLKYAKPILLDDVVIDFPNLRINVEHIWHIPGRK